MVKVLSLVGLSLVYFSVLSIVGTLMCKAFNLTAGKELLLSQVVSISLGVFLLLSGVVKFIPAEKYEDTPLSYVIKKIQGKE